MKDNADIIQRLKDNPQILDTMLEINPDVMRPPTEAERRELFSIAIGLTAIVDTKYKEEITAGLDKTLAGGIAPELTKEANTLWDIILAALLLDPPQDVIKSIADKLGYTARKLGQIKNKAQADELEENNFIPGLEPTAAERHIKAAEIIRQQRIAYELITKRGTSKLDRKAGYMVNTLDNEITMPLDIRRTDPIKESRDIIRIKWNAPYNAQGEQLRVTPFDQEIETIISNFFDEGYPDVTTEQIYAALTGQSGHSAKPNAGTLKDIERSIEKLNTIPVSIRRIQNGTAETLETGEIQIAGGDETIIAEGGTILDTWKTQRVKVQGKIRLAWHTTRLGALYTTEKSLGRLRSISQETLNLAASGITFTELSFILRRWCLLEIARFKTTASFAINDNKFTLDSMYLYEAAPELVSIAPNMKRTLKTGETPNEQAKIRTLKKRRRDLLQAILQHFKQTGEVTEWDFCAGNKKLPYTLDKNEPIKRKYKGTPDSVYIQVQKTPKALGTISTIERRIETAERNRRRADKKDNQG